MKTNIELVNNTYACVVGVAYFFAGRTEDGDPIIEDCDVYRSIDGVEFGYCHILNQVIEDYGDVATITPAYYHHNLPKRGKHSRSNNKRAIRRAKEKKMIDDLPF